VNPGAPTPLSRSMLALMALEQITPNPGIRTLLERMAQDHVRSANRQGDKLFYSDPAALTGDTRLGVMGNGFTVFINGCAIRALCRWSELSGNRTYLE